MDASHGHDSLEAEREGRMTLRADIREDRRVSEFESCRSEGMII